MPLFPEVKTLESSCRFYLHNLSRIQLILTVLIKATLLSHMSLLSEPGRINFLNVNQILSQLSLNLCRLSIRKKRKIPKSTKWFLRHFMTFLFMMPLETHLLPSFPRSFHFGCTNTFAISLLRQEIAIFSSTWLIPSLSLGLSSNATLTGRSSVNNQYSFPFSYVFIACFILLEYKLHMVRDFDFFIHYYIPKA